MINTSTSMIDINLQLEINKAFECKNFTFLKNKFSYAIHERIVELVDYIGKKVTNELSKQERNSFFSDDNYCGIGKGYVIYSRGEVSLGSYLIKLNIDAGMDINKLLYDDLTLLNRRTLLSFIAESTVDSNDTHTQLNLVMLLLFHNAICVPPLSDQAKAKLFGPLYPKASLILNGLESLNSLFSKLPKEIICQILRNYSFKAFEPEKKYITDLDEVSPYDTAQIGNSSFEKKLIRKLTEKPNNEWLLWVKSFADKISFCQVKEAGMALVDKMLDFQDHSPLAHAVRHHLEELVQSGIFLDKCVQKDEWAKNQSEKILICFCKAVEVTTTPSKLIDVTEVPDNIEINPFFISDPRIMLYNILSKSGNSQLSPIDDTIEMELAIILADLREQFLQKIIPQNQKDRPQQEIFIKKKIQGHLALIESLENKNDTDENNIHIIYKRLHVKVLMDYILKGNNSGKFDFTNIKGEKARYTVPIVKHQGYANPQTLIDHVHHAINNSQKPFFKISLLKDRLQSQYGDKALEKMSEYFDENGSITKSAVKALLYSTGYLKELQ